MSMIKVDADKIFGFVLPLPFFVVGGGIVLVILLI